MKKKETYMKAEIHIASDDRFKKHLKDLKSQERTGNGAYPLQSQNEKVGLHIQGIMN